MTRILMMNKVLKIVYVLAFVMCCITLLSKPTKASSSDAASTISIDLESKDNTVTSRNY